jgi:peptidoglycan/LPS O-acetylase OafA/YrhL
MTAIAIPLTGVLAVLSWYLAERPGLAAGPEIISAQRWILAK